MKINMTCQYILRNEHHVPAPYNSGILHHPQALQGPIRAPSHQNSSTYQIYPKERIKKPHPSMYTSMIYYDDQKVQQRDVIYTALQEWRNGQYLSILSILSIHLFIAIGRSFRGE